jgi:long-chain acyl-CoA synthetase
MNTTTAPSTLRQILIHSGKKFADRPVLSMFGDDPMTYRDLVEEVADLSTKLTNEGIDPGDRVAILGDSSPNWGIVYFAIVSMGAVAVPILTEFHADAVQHILRHSEAKLAFVSSRLLNKVEDAPELSKLRILSLETFEPVTFSGTMELFQGMKKASIREWRRFKEKARKEMKNMLDDGGTSEDASFLQRMKGKGLEYLNADQNNGPKESDLAAIIYTSGTTGTSKGVMLSHRNIVSNVQNTLSIVTLTTMDRMLSILPLSHAYECTLGLVLPISVGAHVCYLDKPPTARVMLPALAAFKPTAMLSVPLVMEKIFKTSILPKFTASKIMRTVYALPLMRKKLHRVAGKKLRATFGGKLKIFCIGGASVAPEVDKFLQESGFPYAIGYGLTETSPLVTGTPPGATRLTSAGVALPNVEIRIDDPDPKTGDGEIMTRSPSVMLGYYKDKDTTATVLSDDGWLRTGDLGHVDEDGYLYIRGRIKNMILGPNGENIYPEEVEGVIAQSPHVLESLVYMLSGRLMARVHLDAARLDHELGSIKGTEREQKVEALLDNLRNTVNSKVSTFARLHKIIEQHEPFEKTPTQKIKRYLYVDPM